jgi:hypothetical protein
MNGQLPVERAAHNGHFAIVITRLKPYVHQAAKAGNERLAARVRAIKEC